MRYQMRQKLLSFGNDFTIRDEADRDVYFVDGKAFSIGDKLSFQDLSGRGAFGACEELAAVAELLQAPVSMSRNVVASSAGRYQTKL